MSTLKVLSTSSSSPASRSGRQQSTTKRRRTPRVAPLSIDDVDLHALRFVSVFQSLVAYLTSVGRLVSHNEMVTHLRAAAGGAVHAGVVVDAMIGAGFVVPVDRRYQLIGMRHHVIPLQQAIDELWSPRLKEVAQTASKSRSIVVSHLARALNMRPDATLRYLQVLKRKGIVRRQGIRTWLTCDPVIVPLNLTSRYRRGARVDAVSETDAQIHAVVALVAPGGMGREEICERTGMGRDAVLRGLGRLIVAGRVRMDGASVVSLVAPSTPVPLDRRWLTIAGLMYDDYPAAYRVSEIGERVSMTAESVSVVMAEQKARGMVELVDRVRWRLVEPKMPDVRREIEGARFV